jgi:hypothetical protein
MKAGILSVDVCTTMLVGKVGLRKLKCGGEELRAGGDVSIEV